MLQRFNIFAEEESNYAHLSGAGFVSKAKAQNESMKRGLTATARHVALRVVAISLGDGR